MLKQSSNKTRQKFLRKFVQELVEVRGKQILERKSAMAERERIRKEIQVDKLRTKYVKPLVEKHKLPLPPPRPMMKRSFTPTQIPQQMPIMQARPIPVKQSIPAQLNVPSPDLDLGKILALVRDPNVSSIECPGAEKQVIVKKNNQTMKTEITLNKSEIDKIVQEFSEKARIPLIEGMLRARVANLQITAVVSKVASSRFIIIKTYQPRFPEPNQQQPTMLSRPPIQQPFRQPAQKLIPIIQRPFVQR